MSFCLIPKSLGALGSAGELAVSAAGARSAYTGGFDNPDNVASMGSAVVAAAATAAQMKKSPAFLRGLGMGLAPKASIAQAALNYAALQDAKSSADKFAAGLGILAGVTGTVAGLLPPSPAKVALTAASITASAAQALVQARQPLEQAMLDALDEGTQAFNRFFYSRPGTCDIDRIKKKTSIASTIPSPIVLDLDGGGVETLSLGAGTRFDHAADGFAEKTGWFDKNDGLLVRDINGNGQIDSGRELFGSETLLVDGQKATNGFVALAELDANNDGVIDSGEATIVELRIWKDADGNGQTDAGELLTLAEAGVQSINVNYSNSSFVDAQGNAHRQVGSYTSTNGQTRAATDVWFQTDSTYSVPTEWVDVFEQIAALPDAQGYGKVRDLHQAMAMDATGELKALVTAFIQAATPAEREALVTQIIYRWTGVQDVDPISRASRMIYGNAIGDARKLEALEEFMGEEWVGIWCWRTPDANPHGRAAPVLLQAWDELKSLVYGQLMSQGNLRALFQSIAYQWDTEVDAVVGDLSAVAQTLSARIDSDRETGLADLGDFLYSLRGMGLLDQLDIAGLKAALLPLGADVEQTMEAELRGWVSASGPTEGDDVLRGTEARDLLDGRGGNDRLLGRAGSDTLIGGAGNDVLDGGADNDELRGGIGSDTYRFGRGDGHDTLIEDSWQQGETDRIEFKAGVSPEDVLLTRVRAVNGWLVSDDLRITIRDSGETLTVKNHFNESNRHAVEEIAFADGTVWNTESMKSQTLIGEVGNDELRGFNDRNDIILGGAGSDRLQGLSGGDVLDGGAGYDTLEGGSGAYTHHRNLGAGQDVIKESYDTTQDVLELAPGVTPDDVTVRWITLGDMAVTQGDDTNWGLSISACSGGGRCANEAWRIAA